MMIKKVQQSYEIENPVTVLEQSLMLHKEWPFFH